MSESTGDMIDLGARVVRTGLWGICGSYLSTGRSRASTRLLLSAGTTFLEGIRPSARGDLGKGPNKDLSSTLEKPLGCPHQDKPGFAVQAVRSSRVCIHILCEESLPCSNEERASGDRRFFSR